MKITDWAAWWGAIIATLVLVWDMYKWKRSGPIINVSASLGIKTVGKIPIVKVTVLLTIKYKKKSLYYFNNSVTFSSSS